MRRTKEESDEVGRELRYTQQVVAGELAGWQDLHEKMGRKAIRDLAKGMLTQERSALEGMKRAIRKLKVMPVISPLVMGDLDVEVVINGGSILGTEIAGEDAGEASGSLPPPQ